MEQAVLLKLCSYIRKIFDPSPFCNCCQRNETNPSMKRNDATIPVSTAPDISQRHVSSFSPNVSNNDDPCFPTLEQIIKLKSPTLKYVPKRLRSEWSRAWTETIQDCLFLNDSVSYVSLFLLSKICLQVPPSNLKSRKLKEARVQTTRITPSCSEIF